MNTEQKEIFKTLLPYLLVTALTAASLVLGVLRMTHVIGGASSDPRHMVSFDIVKYANAQRAIASAYMKDSNNDNSTLLLNLSEKTRASIGKLSGGNLVILKQAIVQGSVPDITDAVLKDLGLPTDVPTQDPAAYTLDVAPTMLTLQGPPKEVQGRRAEGAGKDAGSQSVLP